MPGTCSGGSQEGASEEESDKEVTQKTDLLNEILLALKMQEHERMHDEVSSNYFGLLRFLYRRHQGTDVGMMR